uniref:B30.2/SPRY domain-containing protein n=1 Tax=Scleropages formosus TaxID=113540 RepID=A0A8C9RVD5_SCLFO
AQIHVSLLADTSLPWRAAFLCTLLLAIVINKYENAKGNFKYEILSNSDFHEIIIYRSVSVKDVINEIRLFSAVDITLNSNACHSFLKLSSDGKIVRDSGENLPPCGYLDEMYVLGEPSFSSGCAYWEVLLKLPNTKVKEFWGVGVALKNAERPSDGQLSCSKGFWVLSLQDGKLCVNTEPRVVIPVDQGPQTLGVFLDYDSGELSFRDAEKNKDLVTLSAKFSEPVYPLFNPGIGDESALKISTEVTEKPATANLQTKEKIQNSAV